MAALVGASGKKYCRFGVVCFFGEKGRSNGFVS